MADDPILIKRYANRKLYDQGRSRYVTLEELEELIRGGREIRVVDAVSGEDLTSLTLAQIILEKARDRRAVLPPAFLHQLIQHGEAWQQFVQETLAASLSGILASQREADRVLREWTARAGAWLGGPATPPAAAAGAAPEPPPARPPADGDVRAELAALKARLRDLEARLER
jgi:polyhydroxyalkanoate synthesis repressor PhaR